MIARADVDLQPPILLSERGDGAPESMIVTGIASSADVLSYADGDDEVTDGARRDTAEQLRGVPLVSPEDHQRWQQAQAAGQRYEVTPLGTVIEADQDESGAVRFSAAVHGSDAVGRVRRGEWPAVSVGYVAGYTRSDRADRAQARRVVNHLALVPRGRDPHARIRADGADMPTLAEMDLDTMIAALVPKIVTAIMEARKTEIEPLVDADKPADIVMPAGDMAAMEAVKADAAAQKARADAAEARLLEIDRVRVRADAAVVGLTVADTDVADRAALTALEAKIAAAAISKVRADAATNPWHTQPRTQPAAQTLPSIAI